MSSLNDISSDFENIQLEGRLAIYESLIAEAMKLKIVEAMALEIKLKFEDVIKVWNEQKK